MWPFKHFPQAVVTDFKTPNGGFGSGFYDLPVLFLPKVFAIKVSHLQIFEGFFKQSIVNHGDPPPFSQSKRGRPPCRPQGHRPAKWGEIRRNGTPSIPLPSTQFQRLKIIRIASFSASPSLGSGRAAVNGTYKLI